MWVLAGHLPSVLRSLRNPRSSSEPCSLGCGPSWGRSKNLPFMETLGGEWLFSLQQLRELVPPPELPHHPWPGG